jgi:uncharacterized cupredoxin-like copper-binding protein
MSSPPTTSPAFRKIRPLGLGAFAAAALAATVGFAAPPEAHSTTSSRHATAFAFGAPGKSAAVDRTVRITARDVSFDVPSVTMKAGETVRFIVTNEGVADHDFTLGDAATQAAHRKEMLEMAGMDMGQAHHDDANAVFLKSGETKELVWKFGKAGQIEFACNVPGHYEAGMKGVVAIQ